MDLFNYIRLNEDMKQIINHILLYVGHQNDGDYRSVYFDSGTKFRFECDWSHGFLKYDISYITNKGFKSFIKTKGDKQYIHKMIIPIIFEVYNCISQREVNKTIFRVEGARENNELLDKTMELRAICWSLLEYEDNYLKLSLNTHQEKDDYFGYEDVADGHRVTLANGQRVFDYSNDNVYLFKEGNWIEYLANIRNGRV